MPPICSTLDCLVKLFLFCLRLVSDREICCFKYYLNCRSTIDNCWRFSPLTCKQNKQKNYLKPEKIYVRYNNISYVDENTYFSMFSKLIVKLDSSKLNRIVLSADPILVETLHMFNTVNCIRNVQHAVYFNSSNTLPNKRDFVSVTISVAHR